MIEREIFDALPGCFLILLPDSDFTIFDANRNYLEVAGRGRQIIGTPLFKAFPENPSDPRATGVKNLSASLLTVLNTRKPHFMDIQRYDTLREDGNGFEERYWKPSNVPVIGADGKVLYIIHSVEDVTRQVVLSRRLKFRTLAAKQEIEAAISSTQELERLQVGKELHDHVSQILITSKMLLGRAVDKDPADRHLAEKALDHLSKAISEVKKLAAKLAHPIDDGFSFEEELEEMTQQVISYGNIHVDVMNNLGNEVIENNMKTSLLRIIQEFLVNVVKHSEAKNVQLQLNEDSGWIRVQLKDDGKGFDPSLPGRGMGLKTMRSRVAMMDGTIAIQSSPGGGCTIVVMLPKQDFAAE